MAVLTRSESAPYAAHPEKKVALYFVVLGFVALLIGTLFGPLQALNYAGINLYPLLEPLVKSYYQGLTLHGVLNAIVFTQLFAQGFVPYLQARELGLRPNLTLAWVSWWMVFIGLVVAAVPLLTNDATVLFTFYPPLQGHWAFYVGAALIVLSTWITAYISLEMWLRWKRQHPGQVTPLVTYMSVTYWLMWLVASLGLVVEAAVFLIPWSLGIAWKDGVDPLVARTLFWWTGHPIVYFWLLPVYIAAYTMLPRLAGGKLVSDPLARMVFLAFLLFSTPVGFHHQFADPGISPFWKMIHTVLTMMVAVPSLITAFTVGASLEVAGRMRGGRGVLGWIPKLPWRNPVVAAFLLAFIAFIPGGAGGIVNASFTLDYVVHNTAWIVGHFHLQVATMVTLSFMGLSFWLLPHLTGKPLVKPGVALASVWLWFIGMMVMAVGLHWMGLLGVPRRTWISNMVEEGVYAHAAVPMVFNAVAGVILLVAAAMFFYVFFATLLQSRRDAPEAQEAVPFAEVLSGPEGRSSVRAMDRVGLWFGIALALVLLVYLPTLIELFRNMVAAPGMRLW